MSHDASAAGASQFPVVLVNMPFSPLHSPSLGLSLLKAALRAEGISSQVHYFHLSLAKQIGIPLYEFIASSYQGVMGLSGDWLFSHALFENKRDDSHAYVSTILREPQPEHDMPWETLERSIAELLMARLWINAFVDQCVETILQANPRVVGFTSVFQQNTAALAVAKRLKRRRPELITIFGGANFEGAMGRAQFESFPFIDVVISGEAETRFPRVVERLLRGERLGKLVAVQAREPFWGGPAFPDEGESMLRELDHLPVPDFSDFFTQWEAIQLDTPTPPSLLFETSRGCWWGQKQHCTFCGLNGESMAYRSKSPQRALSEFTELTQTHPGFPVVAVDNILDMKYFKSFIQELAARSNPVELFYEVKSNLTRDQVRMLSEARVLKIQPGIESLSDQVLRIIRKGVGGMHNLQFLKWCREWGVLPMWNVLWSFPGEEPAEYERMARLFPLLTHLTPPLAGLSIVLERFSPNFNESRARGFKDVRPMPAYSFVYDVPAEALQDIAYFFTYRHADDRNVWSYAGPVSKRISEWKAEHATAALYSLDEREQLRIFDSRKVAPQTHVSLRGAERWALMACDTVVSLDNLKARYQEQEPAAQGWAPLESVLSRLMEARLLVSDGKSYLSLPIAVTPERFAELSAAA